MKLVELSLVLAYVLVVQKQEKIIVQNHHLGELHIFYLPQTAEMIAQTPLEKIHIVVIGAGLIGPRHAEHVHSNEQTELFGIVDPMPESKAVAEKLGTEHFTSITSMIQYADDNKIPYPDGAIVCTPNHTHVRIAAELASHGIHLLVEKPLSSQVEESQALKVYCEEHNIKLLVGHHRRFNPFIVETKKQLPKVGTPIAIQGTWALKKPSNYFEASPWRTDSKTGGGVLLINLVHDIDLLQYLFGPIVKVYAELLTKQRLEYPNVDEGACLTLKFENGVTGTFICSDNVISPFNFESGTGENPIIPFHHDLEGFYRVFGSNGTLSIPDFSLYHQPEIKGWNTRVTKESLIDNRKDKLYSQLPFDLQLNHFIDVIRDKSDPFCTAEEGMSALLCIDAVIKSIETEMPQYVSNIKDVKPNFEALGLKK